MTDDKLNKFYCKLDHLLAGSMAIGKKYKITSITKNDVNSWLAKEAVGMEIFGGENP